MADGISIRILGDYGPFSRVGKSIGYLLTIGESRFLIDCGAPLFQQIGGHGLKKIKGLIITHCHDDHKRWFSDLALFNKYAPDVSGRVYLLTSEDVYGEIVRAAGPALDKSLSEDSRDVIDIGYEEYIDHRILGPRARYRIVSKDEGKGKTGLYVMDGQGDVVGPEKAKIVISPKTKRPRMLFKDPHYGEWVEPDSFYPFSSTVFFEEERNTYTDREGFTIEALKAPVWHGITGIGIKVTTNGEKLIFSSDTIHDTGLWKRLFTEKRSRMLPMSRRDFETSPVIYGDINDYIERIWSEERYIEAIKAFNDAVVIHDISIGNSVVHTAYERLGATTLRKESTLLTHSPDRITSEWALCRSEKTFKIKGNRFFEIVGDRLYPMNADVYHKESGRYYVGYRNEKGGYMVYDRAGILRISGEEGFSVGADDTPLYRVDLYEDMSGKYFPRIEKKDSVYLERGDGKVEIIEFTEGGSSGRVIEDQRDKLSRIGKDNVRETAASVQDPPQESR